MITGEKHPIPTRLKEQIIEALVKKGPLKPCSRCECTEFYVAGIYHQDLHPHIVKEFCDLICGFAFFSCAIINCDNCGHVNYHQLNALDIELPEE